VARDSTLPHRVWPCSTRKPALLPLSLPPGGQQDLQPAGRAVHRAHCPGAALSGEDADLGTGQSDFTDDGPAGGQASPIAREAVIVGIDGGYLRNWHDKKRNFEVIVGKSMAEDRDDRYLVRSQDAVPERRFCEVLRCQGLPTDQPVTVLTDGGDSVRALVGNLPAGTEHYLDWFRAT
jgi:hypothetical protein